MSCIWKGYDYNKHYHERLPYNDDEMKSIYHVRKLDVRKLFHIRTQADFAFVTSGKPQDHKQLEQFEVLRAPCGGLVGAKAVRMRRTCPVFKASAFISFEDQAARDAFLARDDKRVWAKKR